MTMRFEDKIRILATLYDFSVTSWIRSRRYNTDVGGVPGSLHLLGLAVDVVLENREELSEFMADSRRLELVVFVEEDHIHLQDLAGTR